MEEVRQLVQEEGREARNLVAFHVAVETPVSRVQARKPPRSAPPRRPVARPTRLRSASAGRDKRSELRARYWALLFGDLQRAIGEIYNTVEAHENQNECQEVILVLENYMRDFKALGEWFRLKWDYDNTPPPQRPQSLAWEIRKTDFVRPESRRTHSVKSSPSVSGKNSPCLSGHNTPSGKNSPSLTGKASPGSGKISPRISSHSSTSPKANVEFFSSKIAAKIPPKPETKIVKDPPRLSDIKEKDLKETLENSSNVDQNVLNAKEVTESVIKTVELGRAKEIANVSPKHVVLKTPIKNVNKETRSAETISEQAKQTISKLDAMENEFLAKQLVENSAKNENMLNRDKEIEIEKIASANVNAIDSDATEPEIDGAKDKIEEVNSLTDEKEGSSIESPVKSEDNFGDISNDSSKSTDEKLPFNKNDESTKDIKEDEIPKLENEKTELTDQGLKEAEDNLPNTKPNDESVTNGDINGDKSHEKDIEVKKDETKKVDPKVDLKTVKPAYSQAAAKPKQVPTKPEVKTPTRVANITKAKPIVETRPASAPKTPKMAKRNQTSKCSYPFNLTTGRTSLFDSSFKTPAKKPARQMGAGDAKPPTKRDAKKPPIRPTTLKINEKGDKAEKLNPTLEKIKDCDEYSSSDTIVTQIDISRIESSESLKTLIPEDNVGNSIEVLNVDDNEGWLTVKSRRLSRESKKQSRSHWANRFNQPSATTSLPTLMIESPKQDCNPIVTSANRAKSEQPQLNSETVASTEKEPEAIAQPDIIDQECIEESDNNMKSHEEFVKSQIPLSPTPKSSEAVTPDLPKLKDDYSITASKSADESSPPLLKYDELQKSDDPSIIRQKSDVTGLKTRSARNKAMRKGKAKVRDDEDLTSNRLHSSLESLTTALARSQESTEDIFDFDKWKVEFSNFKYLEDDDQITDQNDILQSADPSEMSEIAEMTSQIEENERKISLALDFQSEVDQRKLSEEEDLLNRQILELQQVSDVDLDTETDDTETDAELICDGAGLEEQYESALASMSWAERVDTLGALEALVARDPGRAQQLHAKLSQSIKRRGSFQDALRRLQAKQARAERQRMEYQTERAKKIHQLLARVEEVKVAKNQLIEEKRLRMEQRLQKAAENRDQHLKDIVRKAHDEEEKLREIAFIKQLEAENRRHEFLDQCRSQNTRLRQMRRERLSKLAAAAAREAAAGARRAALDAARRLRNASLLERRRQRDARVLSHRELLHRERCHANREKAEGVKSRLSALAAAAELEADALRSRIRDKQDATQLRLDRHLQAIRDRATTRIATTSESQDEKSKEEKDIREAAERVERERRDREKQKAIKKRARKVKQKFLTSTYDAFPMPVVEHPPGKLSKVINQISSIISPLEADNNNKTNHNVFEGDKQKKKKEKKNDSVCSSISDLSRGSKSEKKVSVAVDMPFLEKQLNELHRMLEKLEKVGQIQVQDLLKKPATRKNNKPANKIPDRNAEVHEKTAYRKIQGLKVVSQLLAVAAERDDIQFTTKCLGTAVQCVSRAVALNNRGSIVFMCSPLPIHLANILTALLEKDLDSDPKELELAKQVSDCLSIALDSVLCATRIFVEKRGFDDSKLLNNIRSRAHTLISYICLCGCISRAETAGEARESIQTLLTVCADLCHPCEVDTGSERLSAIQSLRCALGTSVCGSRAEFCMLFASGAVLEHSGGFVKAARTAHLLRALAELDHQIVQEAFGEGGWPLEFRAAVARLLSQHAPNDKEAPRTTALRLSNQRLDQTLSEAMVLDLIVLVGFVVVNNPQLQETICDGWTVIKTLCTLPANWLVSKLHSHALLPTLVALSERPSAAAAIARELSMDLLQEYMNSTDAQKIKLVQVIKQGRTKKGKKHTATTD